MSLIRSALAVAARVAIPASCVTCLILACTGDDPPFTDNASLDGSTSTGTSNGETGTSAPMPKLAISGPASVVLVQGGSLTSLDITIERSSGFDEILSVSLTDVPTGIKADALSIPAGLAKGKLTLTALPESTQGTTKTSLTVSNASGSVRANTPIELVVRGKAGVVDSTFGSDGTVPIALGSGAPDIDCASDAIELPDGKLVLLQSAGQTVCKLTRYTANGALDEGFGTKGSVVFRPGGATSPGALLCRSLTVQAGKLIVGSLINSGGANAVTISRFDASGAPDSSFAGDAGTFIDSTHSVALGRAIPDGKGILAVGRNADDTIALVRLTENGSPDTTFGPNGFLETAVGVDVFSETPSILWTQDGGIGVGGKARTTGTGATTGTLVMKYAAGDAQGYQRRLVPPSSEDALGRFDVDVSGRAYVAATLTETSTSRGALFRFPAPNDIAANVIDPSYGVAGLATFDDVAALSHVRVMADGRVVAVGKQGADVSTKIVLVRTSSAGVPDEDFGAKGRAILTDGQPSAAVATVLTKEQRLIVFAHGVVDPTVCFARRIWL